MYHSHENPDPAKDDLYEDRYRRDARYERREARNRTFLYVAAGLLGVIVILILFFALSGRDSHYETGLEYLRAKQYNAALTEFQFVSPSDDEYALAQSKINFINGIKAYNDSNYDEARVYLGKVDERDEFYGEARLMLDQIVSNERQKNLEELLADEKNNKDTVVKERVIQTPTTKTNNSNDPVVTNNTNKDEQAAKKYIASVQSLINKFNATYQSAYTADVESKRNYVANLMSISSQLNGIAYTASEKNAMVIELKGLASKMMNRRIDFINKLISSGIVTEDKYSRAIKEEGDKLLNMTMRQMDKVKSFYNI
jgi:hypothetical protein